MKTSANGRKKLSGFEGTITHAYQDSVGVWTICTGHTAAAGPPSPVSGMTMTAAQCDDLLTKDLGKYEGYVSQYVKVPLSQNQFDALVSLVYNIGPGNFSTSQVVKLLNSGKTQEAADAFRNWTKAGGKVLAGLVTRRNAERALFLTPDTPQIAPVVRSNEAPATSVPEIPQTRPAAPTAPEIDPRLNAKVSPAPSAGTGIAVGTGAAIAASHWLSLGEMVALASIVAIVVALIVHGIRKGTSQ